MQETYPPCITCTRRRELPEQGKDTISGWICKYCEADMDRPRERRYAMNYRETLEAFRIALDA